MGCFEDIVSINEWMNEYGVEKSVNKSWQIHFDCSPIASSSLEFLFLCLFVVGKFIWVSVNLIVKHDHNGLILLGHIQQWACIYSLCKEDTHKILMIEQMYTVHAQVFHANIV